MSNRTIEAILRISTKMGSLNALRTLQGELAKVDGQAKAYTRSQTMMARGMGAAWANLARFIGPMALGYAGVNMVRTGAKIEEAMFNIKKKSGATAEQIAVLKKEILDLGQEVPISIEEIASAFERGAAAGIPLDDLREFAKLTSQVSDAWEMTAADTANAFAGFEAGMGIKRADMEAFADLINYLADSGIADEADIVNFLDRAGASLKNFGMSPEESAAFGAALVNLKMVPEVAARAMDTLAGKLMAPENLSKKSFGALKEIVGDVKEFANLVAKDGTKGMIEFFEKLDKLSGQKRISLLGALMGEGFDDEVARMVGGIAEIKRNLELAQNENVYKGSIAGLSEQRLDLFNSKLQTLWNNLTEIKDKFFESTAKGGGFLDMASGAVGAVNDKIDYDRAIDAQLRKEGMDQSAIDTWRARNLFNRAARDSKAVDGGYNMGKQQLPALAMPGVGPTFFDDVVIPMKRPSNAASGSQFPQILYPSSAPFLPESSSATVRGNAESAFPDGRLDSLDSFLSAGGEEAGAKIKDGVVEGGDTAGGAIAASLIDAGRQVASMIGAAVAAVGRDMMQPIPRVNADTGRSGVETEARNFVP